LKNYFVGQRAASPESAQRQRKCDPCPDHLEIFSTLVLPGEAPSYNETVGD
jgi:hypothetical protein